MYLTLRDTLMHKLKNTGARLLHPFRSQNDQPLTGMANHEEFWALKDINFEIEEGDKHQLLNGHDDIDLILKYESDITRFEETHDSFMN